MSPSSSALESIPSSTSTGAVEIKWVFRVNLWATSFKGIFLEKYPQFSKKNFLSEICRRSQFFVWVGTGRRNLKVATCLNNFLTGISTSAHCTGSYIFFSKIVQKKRQIKKNLQNFSISTCTCVAGTRPDRCKKLYFFFILIVITTSIVKVQNAVVIGWKT